MDSLSGIGGAAEYFPVPAWYAFIQDDGSTITPLATEIWVAQLTPTNQVIPSLLGWDVLHRFRVALDWSQRAVALEAAM